MDRDVEPLDGKEDRIRLVDSLTKNPEERSIKVWNQLNKEGLTDWDLICFCVQVMSMFVSSFPWLTKAVRYLGALVYNAHYRATEEMNICVPGTLTLLELNHKSSLIGPKAVGQATTEKPLSISGVTSGPQNSQAK